MGEVIIIKKWANGFCRVRFPTRSIGNSAVQQSNQRKNEVINYEKTDKENRKFRNY